MITGKEDIVLLPPTKNTEQLISQFNFSTILFPVRDYIIIEATDPKKTLREAKQAKQKGMYVICKPQKPDLLRFVIEKTPADLVYGMESIHPKDSVHFPRGGLDHIMCRFAAETGKTIGFSFSEILSSKQRPFLLGRMKANITLCQKYHVKTFFGSFAGTPEQLRASQDMAAFWRVLCTKKKKIGFRNNYTTPNRSKYL